MIEITIQRGGGRYELRVKGHAGYNPGNDIVCAGCSAVVYSLMGALRNAPEHLDSLTTDAERGHAWVYCEGDAVVGALYRMAEIGLRQIARTHPEHVQVDVKSF